MVVIKSSKYTECIKWNLLLPPQSNPLFKKSKHIYQYRHPYVGVYVNYMHPSVFYYTN